MSDVSRSAHREVRRSKVQLSAEETVDFAADLAQRRATALVEAGHLEEAVGVYDEEARGYRALLGGVTGVVPDPHTARRQALHLGKVLMEMGTLQARLGHGEAAVATTAEALAILRGLGPADSALADYLLSRVLWGYAWVRAGLGVEVPQAVQAVREAESILVELAQAAPASLQGPVRADLPVVRSFLDHLTRISPEGRRPAGS